MHTTVKLMLRGAGRLLDISGDIHSEYSEYLESVRRRYTKDTQNPLYADLHMIGEDLRSVLNSTTLDSLYEKTTEEEKNCKKSCEIDK